jgi:hypothetical protein
MPFRSIHPRWVQLLYLSVSQMLPMDALGMIAVFELGASFPSASEACGGLFCDNDIIDSLDIDSLQGYAQGSCTGCENCANALNKSMSV